MGLDTSHNAWHGAYSAFGRWRDKLAEVAGYRFYRDPRDGREYPSLNWDAITEDNLYGQWEAIPEDPLILLIAHSDCDGEIQPEHCGPLADRLEQLLPRLSGEGGGHIGLYQEKTRQFVDGLRLAAGLGEPLEFR
jgi:hypothetical protein